MAITDSAIRILIDFHRENASGCDEFHEDLNDMYVDTAEALTELLRRREADEPIYTHGCERCGAIFFDKDPCIDPSKPIFCPDCLSKFEKEHEEELIREGRKANLEKQQHEDCTDE